MGQDIVYPAMWCLENQHLPRIGSLFGPYSSVRNKRLFQISIQDGNCLRNLLAYRPDETIRLEFFSELIKHTD